MAGYDLICTYNWGAIDAVMAHTLFADVYKLAPLVHHEDGFNEDEAVRLKTRRNWYRRIALGRTAALVVPSKKLERIALDIWKQPRTDANAFTIGATNAAGVDSQAFTVTIEPPRPPTEADGWTRLPRDIEIWVNKPGQDQDHWLDCCVMCRVGAEIAGYRAAGVRFVKKSYRKAPLTQADVDAKRKGNR